MSNKHIQVKQVAGFIGVEISGGNETALFFKERRHRRSCLRIIKNYAIARTPITMHETSMHSSSQSRAIRSATNLK